MHGKIILKLELRNFMWTELLISVRMAIES